MEAVESYKRSRLLWYGINYSHNFLGTRCIGCQACKTFFFVTFSIDQKVSVVLGNTLQYCWWNICK